jgi:ribosomal protein L7/L12
MAKISIRIENGENSVQCSKESDNLEVLAKDVLDLLNIAFGTKIERLDNGAVKPKQYKVSISDPINERLKRIKALRGLGSYTLVEAKNLDDNLREYGSPVTLPNYLVKESDCRMIETYLEQFYGKVNMIEY